MRICLLLLALLLSAPIGAQAKTGFAYGINAGIGTSSFVALNLTTFERTVLNDNLVMQHGMQIGTSVINTVDDYYIFGMHDPGADQDYVTIVVLSLDDGRIIKSIPTTRSLFELQYDPIRNRVLGIERRQDRYFLIEVDIVNELVSTIAPLEGLERMELCGSAYDFQNELFVIGGTQSGFHVYRAGDGSRISSYFISEVIRNLLYDPGKSAVAAVTIAPDNASAAEFIHFEPLNGTINSRVALNGEGMQLCERAIDHERQLLWLYHSSGRTAYDIKTGEKRHTLSTLEPWIAGFQIHNSSASVAGGFFRGRVYRDSDRDCRFSATDNPLSRVVLEFLPGPSYALSDENGEYKLRRPLGSHTVSVNLPHYWRNSCASLPLSAEINSNETEISGLDFAMEAAADVQRLEVSLISGPLVVGREVHYQLSYRNYGTLPYSGTVAFCHNELLTGFESHPDPSRYTQNVAEWDIRYLPIGHGGEMRVKLRVPADETLAGTEICAKLTSDTQTDPELLSSLEYDEICEDVRNALDPNDMQVYPAGLGEEGAISLVDTVLTYTIRFQNLGTAEAQTVRVLDTLSPDLNIVSLRPGAASHKYSLRLLDDNILEWTFADINLPAMSQDDAGSNGFLKYAIHLRPNLPVGREIKNRAAIYFDFNSPVITNTVRTTLSARSTSVEDSGLEDKIEIQPDEDGRSILLKSRVSLQGRLTVYNVVGQQMYTRTMSGVRTAVMNLAHVPIGRYLLHIETQAGTVHKSFTLVR